LNKNGSPPQIPSIETDKTNLATIATSNSISSEVPLTIDLNDTDITKTVLPNDPALPLPKERIERNVKLSEGPCQIRLLSYPKTLFGNRLRSFQNAWYDNYDWLEYSKSKNAVYCFYCRAFSLNNVAIKGHIDQAFISKGYSNWKDACNAFKSHVKSVCHTNCVESWSVFKSGVSIDVQLKIQNELDLKNREKDRLHNREVLKRLIDIVILLSKTGRSFRGHDESSKSMNKGLFLETVNLLKKYDPIIQAHLEKGPKNAQYLSSKIQNDLIKSLHNVIFQLILKNLNGKKVSIMADETSDCGHIEQMAIVLRYFDDEQNKPIETFISLKQLESTTAESIFNVIKLIILELNLKWESVVSVCFDGAASMAGKISGVQSKCKEQNSKILYVHCFAHCLNLVLVDSCISRMENSIIFDFFGVIQMVYNFIEGSPTRHAIFEQIKNTMNLKLKSLKSLSTTRWACRAEAVSAIRENFSAIIKTIIEVNKITKLPEVKVKGKGIIMHCQSFNFIISLELMHPILQMILKVSQTLQNPSINLLVAINEVKNLRSALQQLRCNNDFYDEAYTTVLKICKEYDIDEPSIKLRKKSKRFDDNIDNEHIFNTKKEEIRVTVLIPMLDSLIYGIDQRFNQDTISLITAVGKMLKLDSNKDDIKLLSSFFNISEEELISEIRLLLSRDLDCVTQLVKQDCMTWLDWFRKNEIEGIYNNFIKIIRDFCVIPVTSASCERAFSKLTHVKSKLRSTMKQDRLDDLMLPYMEQSLANNVDVENVIEEFKKLVPFNRRLLL